jgi:hypothetical protein
MTYRMTVALIGVLVLMVAGCGPEASIQREDGGWEIDRGATPSELPEEFVDHPDEERQYEFSPTPDGCSSREDGDDSDSSVDSYDHPVLGAVLITGLDNDSSHHPEPVVDEDNYDVYIRFPRKSERWHRFEIRHDSDRDQIGSRAAFKELWDTHSYLRPISFGLAYKLRMPSCDLPTSEQIDEFLDHHMEIEMVFHDIATNRAFVIGPEEPREFVARRPSVVLSRHSRAAASVWFDAALNRPPRHGGVIGDAQPPGERSDEFGDMSGPWGRDNYRDGDDGGEEDDEDDD